MKIQVMKVVLAIPEDVNPDRIRDLLDNLRDKNPALIIEWTENVDTNKRKYAIKTSRITKSIEQLFCSGRVVHDRSEITTS